MPNPETKSRGRPLKFLTPEDLQAKIDAYFADCDPHVAEHEVIREVKYETEDVELSSEDFEVDEESSESKPFKPRKGKISRWKKEVVEETYITDQKPYTISGLAVFLGTSRQTLLEYQGEVEGREDKDPLYADTIKRAKDKIQAYAEEQTFRPSQVAGVIFNLKNNWGWKDQQDLEVNPSGKSIGVVYLPKRDDVPDNTS